MTETRVGQRHRVLNSGNIEFGGGAIDCAARDLSPMGAALEVVSFIGMPAEFKLVIIADELKRCWQVVWRREKRIGVTFVDR